MATRSTIALEFADGTVQSVYCHWDGYLSNNGKILNVSYTDPFKVRDLIDHGDMSVLRQTIQDCEFYRDHGEGDVESIKFKSVSDYENRLLGEEYDYILRRDGKWYVRFYASEGEWVDFNDAYLLEKIVA